ncbi:OLC1v1007900C1 [Oldenlandia corymbosa var. corymbosa]|uniref:OLC1v1007900C1 n=1 Tax=Oldenlandia corymbosa var. corymbosa TaxID=529605 RepID=A0AAV1DMS7_OLDCO|nr:OLC1v1007900C1 [Oldenlandia corymbosa var. corymbosa]
MEWKAHHSVVNPHWDNRRSYVVEGEEVTEGLPLPPLVSKENCDTHQRSRKVREQESRLSVHFRTRILYADILNNIYHTIDEYRTNYPTRDSPLNTMIDKVLSDSFTASTIGPDALSTMSSQRLVESQLTLSQQPQPPQKKGPQKNIGGGRKIRIPQPLKADYGQSITDRRIVPYRDSMIVDEEEGQEEEKSDKERKEESEEEATPPPKESSQKNESMSDGL